MIIFQVSLHTQRVPSTHMGNPYPDHKGNYHYRNHTLYHIGTLDPLGQAFPISGLGGPVRKTRV